MAEINENNALYLSTVESDIKSLESGLNKTSGRGAALLQYIISPDDVLALKNEAFTLPDDSEMAGNSWSHSLRLNEGDQTVVERLAAIRGLADSLSNLVRFGLATSHDNFKRLESWEPTELSVIHNEIVPEKKVVRKWHERAPERSFNAIPPRFWGVIAIATIEGGADFRTNGGDEAIWELNPGDVVFVRGANLFSTYDSSTFRPKYTFDNISPEGHTAVIFRANSQPQVKDPHYTYDNWLVESKS